MRVVDAGHPASAHDVFPEKALHHLQGDEGADQQDPPLITTGVLMR